ncbi:putative bifunctional diguanylate cyclase/phosphodiesterase [Halomonas sp. NCCP-2165]|nr:EAL domain-containing protein [Halomonas sp. NCCP-2165]
MMHWWLTPGYAFSPWLALPLALLTLLLGSLTCYSLRLTRGAIFKERLQLGGLALILLALQPSLGLALIPPSPHASSPLPLLSLAMGLSGGALLTLMMLRLEQHLLGKESLHHMSSERLRHIVASLGDGILLLDDKARILMCNDTLADLVGRPQQALIGQPASHWITANEASLQRCLSRADDQDQGSHEVDIHHCDGDTFPARIALRRVCYSHSGRRHYVVTVTDIRAQRAAQSRIQQLAYRDSLTGLPNRLALMEQLLQRLERNESGTLLLLDVDGFKALNNTLGQSIGDQLLCQLAGRLKEWVADKRLIARIGGNEFALLFPGLGGQEAVDAAQAIQDTLNDTYRLAGHRYLCRLSAGLAGFEVADGDEAALVRRTSLALTEAKKRGDSRVQRFDPALEQALEGRLRLEVELRQAMTGNQLRLYLQPLVDHQGQLVGAEGLIRWQHPERGLVPPGHFIPFAEETGLILSLGQWVIEEACRRLGTWATTPHLRQLRLSININVQQLQQPDFIEEVSASLQRHAAPAQRLTLELTESLLIDEIDSAAATLAGLSRLGIKLALDDFGTGYSALAYLQRLPLDILKIDRTFVQRLGEQPETLAITRTILQLAEALSLEVVAEGIETPEQYLALEALGCRIFQGYLFGRPQPREAFEALAKGKTAAYALEAPVGRDSSVGRATDL